jgi:hypothetical protein
MPRDEVELEADVELEAEVAKKVRRRRWKRRLKAAASLVLASAAGTFLACTKGDKNRPPPAPNPTTPEVSNLPAPPTPPAPARDAGQDAGAADAGHTPERHKHKDGHVDRTEHRKGMPVPDNLLE